MVDGDEIIAALPVRDSSDELAVFTKAGVGKKIPLTEFPKQKRAAKGLLCYKSAEVACATLVSNTDKILLVGQNNSLCMEAKEIPSASRSAAGNQIIKTQKLLSVSKV